MTWILLRITALACVIAARLISWWFRKPYRWGHAAVAEAIIAWNRQELERAIREWD